MKQSWMVRFRDASSWPTDPKMKFIPCTLTIIARFGSNEVICLCNYHANELIISILPTPACTILLRSRLISVPRLSVRESPKIIVSHAQKDNRRWDADNQVLYSWQNECSYITSRDLPGEFLSNTVDAVTVISITNSSEVLDTIATVGIGCWCQDCGCQGCSRRIRWDQRSSWRICRGECERPATFIAENISFCIYHGAGSCCHRNLSWWRVVSYIW